MPTVNTFTNREIFEEICNILGTRERYSVAYVLRVRNHTDRSDELEKLIAQAIANLESKAAEAAKSAPSTIE